MKPAKHTIESATIALINKGINYLTVDQVTEHTVTVTDKDYGTYYIDIKNLAPLSTVAPHKNRKHEARLERMRLKYVGKTVKGLTVLDLFYGPDRGYKNRSFYLTVAGTCGHTTINTYAGITRHKKTFSCQACSATIHGYRGKTNGVLKKRTTTYTTWQRVKNTLNPKYQDFEVFRREIGEKPFKKAEIRELNGKLAWFNIAIVEESEINLIATAVRAAFHHSEIYKQCVANSRVETELGPRYRCATCFLLFKRTEVEVDHIDPIKPIDGSGLTRINVIDRIFTEGVQILDKGCHTKKSTVENKERRLAKKEKGKK